MSEEFVVAVPRPIRERTIVKHQEVPVVSVVVMATNHLQAVAEAKRLLVERNVIDPSTDIRLTARSVRLEPKVGQRWEAAVNVARGKALLALGVAS